MKSFVLVFSFLVFLFLLPVFLVNFEKVECIEKDDVFCSLETSSFLKQFERKNFFSIYSSKKNFFSTPSILNYKFTFFPFEKKVVLRVDENKPFIAIDNFQHSFFLVSNEGVLVQKTGRKLDIPVVGVKDFNYEVGDKISDDLLLSLKAFFYIHRLYKVEKGIIFNDRVEIYMKDGPALILPRGDYKTVLSRTVFLLNTISTIPEKFNLDKSLTYITIDLRYKNPVLR